MIELLIVAVGIFAFFVGCAKPAELRKNNSTSKSITLLAPGFDVNGSVPKSATCMGANFSPAVSWSGFPAGTRSWAMVMVDRSDHDFVHWLVYGIAKDVHSLPQHLAHQARLSSGEKQGRNSFGKIGYSGPCPPPGAAHIYQLSLYGLNSMLKLKRGLQFSHLIKGLRGHVLAKVSLQARFSR